MNGFEKHNIDHLSASSINLWSNAPDVWVMQYLHGIRTPMGPAPWRGICAEDAVVEILSGGNERQAIDKALAKFDKRFLIGTEATSKERELIEPMVQLAYEHQHGVVIDLKTTTRVPSTMSAEHQLQRAIYQKAKGNMGVKFLYVSAKKANMLEDGDVNETLAKAKKQIARMEAFLRCLDKETAKSIVPVKPDSFYWNGNEALRKDFYGI